MQKDGSDSCRDGWTLLELLVVMTLLALMTLGSHLMLSKVMSANRHRNEQEAILLLDHSARTSARRFTRSSTLNFDWLRTVRVQLSDSARGSTRVRSQVAAASLEEMQLLGQKSATREERVLINRRGSSPTYVLCFRSSTAERNWVIVAGESGQAISDVTEREINELAEILQ